MLTDLQSRKLTHLFEVMDSNGDGQLEWSDFERIADKIAGTKGLEPGSAGYDALMGQYRYGWQQAEPFVEGDDGMSVDAYLASYDRILATPGVYDTLVRPSAEMIFDIFDMDGDEKVTVDEWREFFRCHSIEPSEADRCFEKYDLNEDGYVSRSELVDLVGQFYLSSDPDAPGNYLFGSYSA